MCNCGKKRNTYTASNATGSNINAVQQIQSQSFAQSRQPVLFKYTGSTALSVIGNVTKKSYRFQFTGDQKHIDARDAEGMIRIPILKKIS